MYKVDVRAYSGPLFSLSLERVTIDLDVFTKGQLISKQNCRAVTSPKKGTKRTQDSTSPKKGTKRTQDTILSAFRSFFWILS